MSGKEVAYGAASDPEFESLATSLFQPHLLLLHNVVRLLCCSPFIVILVMFAAMLVVVVRPCARQLWLASLLPA